MPGDNDRPAAEDAAREMLRDVLGDDYSDTTLRVATDRLLSFQRRMRASHALTDAPLARLIEIAKSDTGQSERVTQHLMA